jgi:hypothetical protein
MDLETLISEGWEERGETACASHGGDHSCTIYMHPDDENTMKYHCPERDQVFD